eukprot:TRINITY_DN6348_c0_g2_i1.p1 TRINITY_DN6348_c0_g2~~TRINITY_DN6348_c0_g2_i1.p1  ORF type:complete len:879 (+),score=222.69 TRINITY_DN6348_c0_g2_i1:108-2744(+)
MAEITTPLHAPEGDPGDTAALKRQVRDLEQAIEVLSDDLAGKSDNDQKLAAVQQAAALERLCCRETEGRLNAVLDEQTGRLDVYDELRKRERRASEVCRQTSQLRRERNAPGRSPRSNERAGSDGRVSPRPADGGKKTVQWKKGALLGQGAFGTVHVGVMSQTGEWMAVKNIKFNPKDPGIKKKIAQLQNEIALMKVLQHPNIVRYFFSERCGDSINIFMEYVAGGSMQEMIKQFGALHIELVNFYTREVLLGIEYLHSRNVIHRDIKAANILLGINGECRLADFGCSSAISTSCARRSSLQGTPLWMAPEVVTGQEYGTSVDVWSLGCTVMEMMTAQPPFAHLGLNQMGFLRWITGDGENEPEPVTDKLPPEIEDEVAVGAKEVIVSCLQHDPDARKTAPDLLSHWWVQLSEPEGVHDEEPEEDTGDARPRRAMLRASANMLESSNSRMHMYRVWWKLGRFALAHRLRERTFAQKLPPGIVALSSPSPSTPRQHRGSRPVNLHSPVVSPTSDDSQSIREAAREMDGQTVTTMTEAHVLSPHRMPDRVATGFSMATEMVQPGQLEQQARESDGDSGDEVRSDATSANPFSWIKSAGASEGSFFGGSRLPGASMSGSKDRSPQKLSDFALGMRVLHERRGEGEVTRLQRSLRDEDDGVMTVFFQGSGDVSYRAKSLLKGRLRPLGQRRRPPRRIRTAAPGTVPSTAPVPSPPVSPPTAPRPICSGGAVTLQVPGGQSQRAADKPQARRPSVLPSASYFKAGTSPQRESNVAAMADKAGKMHSFLQKRASVFQQSFAADAAEVNVARVVDEVMDAECASQGHTPRTSRAGFGTEPESGGEEATTPLHEQVQKAQRIESSLRRKKDQQSESPKSGAPSSAD